MFGIFYFLLNFAVGFFALKLLGDKISFWTRICAALLLGMLFGGWLAFVPGLFLKNLLWASILSIFLQAGFLVFLYFKKGRNFFSFSDIEKPGRFETAVFLFLLALMGFLVYMNMLREKDGGFVTNAWGDTAIHLTIINSYSKADNFPPQYPIYAGEKMAYPGLFDFYSAILNRLGAEIRLSIWVPTIAAAIGLYFLFFAFARIMTASRKFGVLALFLFLFNGGLGFIHFFGKAKDVGFWEAIFKNTIDYTHSDDFGVRLMNFLLNFMSQRNALFGYALILLVALFIIPKFIKKEKIRAEEYFFWGLVAGLIPLVHAHSYLSLMAVLFLTALFLRQWDFSYFLAPAVLLAAPQFLFMRSQTTMPGFFGIDLGWMTTTPGFPAFISFWWNNAGFLLPLSLFAVFFLSRRKKVFYGSVYFLFIIANIFRFQPWEFDNAKIFMVWAMFCAVASAEVLKEVVKTRYFGKPVLFLIVFSMTFAGFLSVIFMLNRPYELYNKKDAAIAESIDNLLPKQAIVLTSSDHNHILPMLTGRAIYRGYPGWLWSHGIIDERREKQKQMFEGGVAKDFFQQEKITHVFIGPKERVANDFIVNESFFEANFEKIFDRSGISIYKI